ncbi:MAG: hypothetical protein WC809_02040 [Sinimarinibacterium sp.]|jgi:polyhydroxybutyrate depolymerase
MRISRDAAVWAGFTAVFVAVLAALVARHLHFGAALNQAVFDYPAHPPATCAPLPGKPEPDDVVPRYRVRAPANYDPGYRHPLLVVFSPAGFTAALSERHLGLTRAATAAGLLVAYVDSMPLSLAAIDAFARVPQRVARQWCVHPARITLAGHSDGGTIAQVVALSGAQDGDRPAAIAASAAGILATDIRAHDCPLALDVRLWHGADDGHFPGYGASATAGWAHCLGCSAAQPMEAGGCIRYAGCRGSLEYCEHGGGHLRWPPQATTALVSLAASARRD